MQKRSDFSNMQYRDAVSAAVASTVWSDLAKSIGMGDITFTSFKPRLDTFTKEDIDFIVAKLTYEKTLINNLIQKARLGTFINKTSHFTPSGTSGTVATNPNKFDTGVGNINIPNTTPLKPFWNTSFGQFLIDFSGVTTNNNTNNNTTTDPNANNNGNIWQDGQNPNLLPVKKNHTVLYIALGVGGFLLLGTVIIIIAVKSGKPSAKK